MYPHIYIHILSGSGWTVVFDVQRIIVPCSETYSSGAGSGTCRQRVKISNSRSSWKLLTKGVPQGSILGPFLFNVFMNDLFLFIQNCKLYNYADDNSMINSSPDINAILTNLKHDCKNAIKWFGYNSMKANPDKFQFMVWSSDPLKQQKIEIENDITLLSEFRVKLLGVIITVGELRSALCTTRSVPRHFLDVR